MNLPPDKDRRRLLKASTGLLTGWVIAGSPLAMLARGRAWALNLSAFTTSEATTLTAMARTLFPHDKLDDLAYALVVQSFDLECLNDEKTFKLIRSGIHSLPADFAINSEATRIEALKQIESTEFFQTVRQKTMQFLYSSPMAYAYFGYEGEAFSKGGYLLRGFNDLHWLPEVPADDSGPMPTGPRS
jgi:hypothetical protein